MAKLEDNNSSMITDLVCEILSSDLRDSLNEAREELLCASLDHARFLRNQPHVVSNLEFDSAHEALARAMHVYNTAEDKYYSEMFETFKDRIELFFPAIWAGFAEKILTEKELILLVEGYVESLAGE